MLTTLTGWTLTAGTIGVLALLLPVHKILPDALLVLGLAGALGLQRLDRRPLTHSTED